jgi:RNA polymerase sporulation-specific sigma factor
MIIESFGAFLNKIMFFSAYVNNKNSFEKPLTQEEEKKYLDLYQNGNGEEKEEAKKVLLSRNLRLVAHISKKFNSSGVEADDLISVGSIGLIKALKTYKLDKGSQFSTYASRCIENEILMLLRSSKKHGNTYGLESPIGTDKDGNELTIADTIEDTNVDLFEDAHKTIVAQKLSKIIDGVLTKREKEIINMRYGLNGQHVLTQREIANKLKISRSYISRIENKALAEIKKLVDADDFFKDN